jgi:hypothetical protein
MPTIQDFQYLKKFLISLINYLRKFRTYFFLIKKKSIQLF